MHRAPHFSFRRASGVLLLLAAWLTLSNHCALAALGQGTASDKSAALRKCCAGKVPAGEETPPAAPGGMCCKSLRVLPTDTPVKLVQAQENVLLFELIWTALCEAPAVRLVVGEVARATGPPRAESFAEMVLQRSLLSHAPPLAA